jgi:hypothetical protein
VFFGLRPKNTSTSSPYNGKPQRTIGAWHLSKSLRKIKIAR